MGRKFTTIDRKEREYIPKDWLDENDKPEKDALKFKYKPLSKRQLADFVDSSSRMSITSNTVILGTSAIDIEVFKTAIVGWSNFIVDGRAFKFNINSETLDEAIEVLDLDIIGEVANHIIKTSKFSEEDKGK